MFAKEHVTKGQQKSTRQKENSAQLQNLLKNAQERLQILESNNQQNLREKDAELAKIQVNYMC